MAAGCRRIRERINAITIIDVSQPFHSQISVYPVDSHFSARMVSSFENGDMCEVSEIRMGEHCGALC